MWSDCQYYKVLAVAYGLILIFFPSVSLRIRMLTSGVVMIVMFGVTIALVKIDTDECKCLLNVKFNIIERRSHHVLTVEKIY